MSKDDEIPEKAPEENSDSQDKNSQNKENLDKSCADKTDVPKDVDNILSDGNSHLNSDNQKSLPILTEPTSQKSENKDHEKEDNDKPDWHGVLVFIGIIIVIILIILSIGYLFRKYKGTYYQDAEVFAEEDELESKEKQLAAIESVIVDLEAKKREIDRKEKIYLRTARAVIGIILLIANFCFYSKYILWDGSFELGKMLSFNSSLLLTYSFFAFITYGTPTNLVNALKEMITNYLKRKNIDTLTELEELIKIREVLKKEIEVLKKKTKNE